MILGWNSHRLFHCLISFRSWPVKNALSEAWGCKSELKFTTCKKCMVKVFHEIQLAEYFGEVAEPWANGPEVV